jgi:KDO2-lipid IV(A) lauroyltransferase
MDETARKRLARAHFAALGRSVVERGIAWWAGAERVRRIVRIEGLEHLKCGRPVILLTPHFLGLDIGATRLAQEIDAVSIYSRQKDPVVDRLLYHGRSRFGDQLLLSRQDSLGKSVRALRDGRPFYYLPDMDYGERDAIFVPFFGVPAATITALPRMARLARAVVVTCVTRMLPGGRGYVMELGAPWQDFPTDDVEADTRRMNAFIEERVRRMPEQYYWVHRRFKTRPPGQPKIY